MLHAAIARPDKVSALVGVAVAADHLVTTFKKLPIEVNVDAWLLCNLVTYQAFRRLWCSNCFSCKSSDKFSLFVVEVS